MLVLAAGSDVEIARGTTNANGIFTVDGLEVGEYDIEVDESGIPDSLEVARIDTSRVRLERDDTVAVSIALSFPSVDASEPGHSKLAAGSSWKVWLSHQPEYSGTRHFIFATKRGP